MKKFIYILCILSLIINSCATQNNPPAVNEDDKVVIKNEELEYEIIIIEPGFNSWLITQQPMSYFSEIRLESRNIYWVNEWNSRVLQPRKYDPNLYQMQIDYSSHIDYGKEVNYKLFMYFTYFQQRYNQRF